MAHITIPVKIVGSHPEGKVVFDATLRVPLVETDPAEIGKAADAVLGFDWPTAEIAVRRSA
jgi:hypothetical protein